MTDREKLIALIMSSGQVSGFAGGLADHLIANGVVVREKGEWMLDGRCSVCQKNPLTTHVSFCPACGSDMRKMSRTADGGLASWYADELANDIQVETGAFKK